MKLETFFEKFDLFADAPGAVAKMRELVLELAVQGKLTSALASDGTVPSIVEFRKTAAALANSLGLRSPKVLIEEAEPSFDVPSHWRWMALADIGVAQTGTTPSKTDHDAFNGDVPFIKPADILPNSINYSNESLSRHGAESGSRIAPSGSLLMVCIGTIGKCNLIERECAFNQQINSLTPVDTVDSRYLLVAARSRSFQDAAWKKSSSTTIAILNKGKWLSIAVPLPPLAEQKRIVAKVDELMALCDRLEAQQQERETRYAALVPASLARFADAPTPDNLPFLFHPSYAIPPDALRKTILTLAVQGKLVPQDPNDGDAREMIERAMEKRQRTIKAKSLRRKELDESADLFEHADLPSSWCVERFANLVDPENTISYGVLVPGNDVPDGIPFVRAQDLCLSNHPARPNKTIAPEIEKPYARTRLIGGEILLCVVGSIGKLGVVPDSWAGANIARAVARIKPIPDVLRDYLLLVLQEQSVQNFFTLTTRTLAQPTLNVGMIEQTPIPIPPLSEQCRIVAKVEQLMSLVDALEAQLATSRTTATKLLSALVAELTIQA